MNSFTTNMVLDAVAITPETSVSTGANARQANGQSGSDTDRDTTYTPTYTQLHVLGNSRPAQSSTLSAFTPHNRNSFHTVNRALDQDFRNDMTQQPGTLSGNGFAMDNGSGNQINQNFLEQFNQMRNEMRLLTEDQESRKKLESQLKKLEAENQLLKEARKPRSNKYKNPRVRKLAKVVYQTTEQFDPTQSIHTGRNSELRKSLVDELQTRGSIEVPRIDIDDIYLAVQRLYENTKKKAKVETLSPTKRADKKTKENMRSRQQLTRELRRKVVLTKEEEELWRNITNDIMSDEELDKEAKTITIKKPSWRTTEINNLIEVLDKRLATTRVSNYFRVRSEVPSPRQKPKNYHNFSKFVTQD